MFNVTQSALRLLLAAALALVPTLGDAHDARQWTGENWVATWATGPAGPPSNSQLLRFNQQTVRLIVHTSIGGSQVRVRLSNEHGNSPLRIGAAHVALRIAGAVIVPGSDRVLTFSGSPTVVIPPRAPVLSDPVTLQVPPMSDLAVSLYFPGAAFGTTVHGLSYQTSYISVAGNYAGATSMPVQQAMTSWPFLTEIDVQSSFLDASIVAFGDSITDGASTIYDANHRWPDFLFRRLHAQQNSLSAATAEQNSLLAQRALGVANRGIGGNRLLRTLPSSTVGPAGLVRFDRDVLAAAGVEYLIVLLGINDIGFAGAFTPASEAVTAEDLIAGYRQLIARAHAKGIVVFGGTLTPFEGTGVPGFYTADKEAVRQAVNAWIRTSSEFDAVIDFDLAIRDPGNPARILPVFDSGDHLHPNDAGMQAMANAIPLSLFSDFAFAKLRQTPSK